MTFGDNISNHASLLSRLSATLLFALLIFLSFNKHSRSERFTYQSQIWADKAGYYIYLPATFHYAFDAERLPKDIEAKTGNGFRVDHPSGIIQTKYTCGVALLQSPFYAMATFVAPESDNYLGFSKTHHSFVDIASVFYLFLGLILLYKYLRFHVSKRSAFTSVSLLFLSTNLFYYGIDETGMSHVYSFFLFSLLLYSIKKTNWITKANSQQTIFIGFAIGLCILNRPTNLFFVFILLFLEARNLKQIKSRLQTLLNFKTICLLTFPAFLVWVPQLIYWYSLSGSPMHYSYANEGFNLFNPQLLKFLFSPEAGWLTFAPGITLFVCSLLVYFSKNKLNAFIISISLLSLVYLFSSWWDWHYGCSFGSRSMVEYSVLLLLPMALFLESYQGWFKVQKVFLMTISIVACVLNLQLSYSFDQCFFGNGPWDWAEYFDLLTKAI